jgi:hypothetical protein
VQVEPEVLDGAGPVGGGGRLHVDALLEAGEELLDDLVLVAEVVVQVSGAHAELGGDHPGGDVRLAQLVEESQAASEDARARALGAYGIAIRFGRHDGGETITPCAPSSAAGPAARRAARPRPFGRRSAADFARGPEVEPAVRVA